MGSFSGGLQVGVSLLLDSLPHKPLTAITLETLNPTVTSSKGSRRLILSLLGAQMGSPWCLRTQLGGDYNTSRHWTWTPSWVAGQQSLTVLGSQFTNPILSQTQINTQSKLLALDPLRVAG